MRLHVANPRPLCDRFLRFIVRCFFLRKIIIITIQPIIMRHYISCRAWTQFSRLTGRWCHRCGKGPEIRSELRDGQTPADRTDIVARVFYLELKELMQMFTHQQVMGRVVAYVYVIDHQKIGLPHSHILLILAPEDKPHSTDDYDRFVCAELPDKQKHPQLYDTVAKNMIHGPCGVLNPYSVCMSDGNCSKKFPKDPCATTT